MTDYAGPDFQLVEETTPEQLARRGPGSVSAPLLVRGLARAWPAWTEWTFDKLAEMRRPDGTEVLCRFQQGLVEQGATAPLPVLPVAPFLRELAEASRVPVPAECGLLPESRRKNLSHGDRFKLNWSHMQSFQTNRRYLADWPVLEEFPALRGDFALRSLWPGLRWTWEYMFVGPGNTVTGLHLDIHNNWFCQVRGTKELILIPPDQTPHMCISKKYNLGSVLSRIDISRLDTPSRESAEFGKTRGFYARVEEGDALYIPKRTWHAVVSLAPSISLATFGLSALEIVTEGAWAEFRNILHLLRLYRWRNCICHEAAPVPQR